jgi:hypothetical protein
MSILRMTMAVGFALLSLNQVSAATASSCDSGPSSAKDGQQVSKFWIFEILELPMAFRAGDDGDRRLLWRSRAALRQDLHPAIAILFCCASRISNIQNLETC